MNMEFTTLQILKVVRGYYNYVDFNLDCQSGLQCSAGVQPD